MAHDVFISYSSHDKATADAACAVMEHRGIRCWMAPRDILPGQDWATSIIQAINTSKVFLLIFSEASNASGQVKREVERAANRNLPIIPFRITDTAPNETLEFFISTPHWLDAFTPPLHAHAERLADTVERLVGQPKAWPDSTREEPADPAPSPRERPTKRAVEAPLPEPEDVTPEPKGFAAATAAHGAFFLLASAVVGAGLYSSALAVPGANMWLLTPLFAAPVCVVLWGWRKLGVIQAVLWIALMSGAHFLAIETTSNLDQNKAFMAGSDFMRTVAAFATGGVIGGGISLGSLVLLGRALLGRRNALAALVFTLVLGVAAGVSGIAFMKGVASWQLSLFVPWQLVFGVSILATVQGRLWALTPTRTPFLPPPGQVSAVMTAAVAAMALLTFTLVDHDLFKKPDTPPDSTAEAAAAANSAASAAAAATAAATPEALAPAPAPAPAKPAPTRASAPSQDDDPIGAGGFITPPSAPSTAGGESFTPVTQ